MPDDEERLLERLRARDPQALTALVTRATLGILWSQLEGGPPLGWGLAAVFAGFNIVWLRYRLLLRGTASGAAG